MPEHSTIVADKEVYQQLGALQNQVDNLTESQKEMNGKLDTLLARSHVEQGKRSVVVRGISTFAGLAALVIAAGQWFASLGHK